MQLNLIKKNLNLIYNKFPTFPRCKEAEGPPRRGRTREPLATGGGGLAAVSRIRAGRATLSSWGTTSAPGILLSSLSHLTIRTSRMPRRGVSCG